MYLRRTDACDWFLTWYIGGLEVIARWAEQHQNNMVPYPKCSTAKRANEN